MKWERSLFWFACTSEVLSINLYPHKSWLLYTMIFCRLSFTFSRCYNDTVCKYFTLTPWVSNFEISSTVSFCCNVIDWIVTLFAVQCKKVRIRYSCYMQCVESPVVFKVSPAFSILCLTRDFIHQCHPPYPSHRKWRTRNHGKSNTNNNMAAQQTPPTSHRISATIGTA